LFKHVLVPFDGSDVALAALESVATAVGPESNVVLLQVVDSPDKILMLTTPAGFDLGIPSVDSSIFESTVKAQRDAASAHLESARATLTARGLTVTDTMIAEGSPGEEIVRIATQGDFDLIVMGTHGRSGLFRSVLGSVADYVLLHVRDIPVLLLHPQEPE
jgi:nucleotide-binding universal stress UspA family protein